MEDRFQFCPQCGKAAGAAANPFAPPAAGPRVRLARLMYDKKIAGVCSGVARYFGVDATLVRVLWLLTFLLAGTGFLAYVICWIVLPREEHPLQGLTTDPSMLRSVP